MNRCSNTIQFREAILKYKHMKDTCNFCGQGFQKTSCLKIYLLMLERQTRFMKRRRDKNEHLLSAGSLPKWPQMHKNSCFEISSQKFLRGLPWQCRVPGFRAVPYCLGVQQRSGCGVQEAGPEPRPIQNPSICKVKILPMSHHASPRKQTFEITVIRYNLLITVPPNVNVPKTSHIEVFLS